MIKHLILILSLMLALTACSHKKYPAPTETSPVITPEFPPEIQDEDIEALMPMVTVTEFINHTAFEKERNQKAIECLKRTVRGECYKEKWLARKLIQTNGKTNQQILDELINGDVKVKWSMYRSFKNTIGYTYPLPYNTIHGNRKYYDKMDPCDIGTNLVHEVYHKLNYAHAQNPSESRPYSVPYSAGIIMGQCYKEQK